jgi:hypothetical protein
LPPREPNHFAPLEPLSDERSGHENLFLFGRARHCAPGSGRTGDIGRRSADAPCAGNRDDHACISTINGTTVIPSITSVGVTTSPNQRVANCSSQLQQCQRNCALQ